MLFAISDPNACVYLEHRRILGTAAWPQTILDPYTWRYRLDSSLFHTSTSLSGMDQIHGLLDMSGIQAPRAHTLTSDDGEHHVHVFQLDDRSAGCELFLYYALLEQEHAVTQDGIRARVRAREPPRE